MLQVNQLRFTYPGTDQATLKELNFSIGEGEIFGFLGPSGSGKSTTQKILYKILKGYEGRVSFMGKGLDAWGQEFYNEIGVCFELPNHYSKLSARENLNFFRSFYQVPTKDPMELLEMVGLEKDADKRVSDFSKGMKMRLNFIRALIHDPKFLFLDEPTSGLDPINARMIKDIILNLRNEGKTFFVTTHNMFDADELCDRVALLHQGNMVAMEQPSELKLRYGKDKVKVEMDNGTRYEFDLSTLGENQAFISQIKQQKIRTIHSEEASLEDVFIQLTGVGLA
ncbi:MAG: ABC transporter ATP-binding protein [Bacteroidota bacterium]|nr:ABC transporter ATP-binding protein [Bacteroidota bacterium]MDX5431210.1 ABC transporter ATP-binding protein [Bacteroidota bacterium]MDX5469949.1 ABC transporter ATP-binding protein [Bacteroidota bacterium]